MADVNAKDILIGLAMALFFIVGGVSLLMEFSKDDQSYINAANYSIYNKTFNKYDAMSSGISSMKNNISGANAIGNIGSNTDTFQNNIIFQSWTALTSIGSLFSFAFSASDGIFSGISTVLGIPEWIVSFLVLVMSITLIWAILSLILRRW